MSAALTSLPSRCWAEIDLAALQHNADVASKQSGCALMAVVKANGYGHGAVPVARALQDKVALFGVANQFEADELRSGGITTPIMLLSACLLEEKESAVRKGYHMCVSSVSEANALNVMACKLGVKALVHLVVDTGMGRLGFTEEAWTLELLKSLQEFEHLDWIGLASHLPSPDEDEDFTREEIRHFRRCVEKAHEAGLQPKWVHLTNSAGLLGYEEARGLCNLARPGLMLYGVSPLPESQSLLKAVLTWKTKITIVRELPAGHGVSYGRTFVTDKPTLVATLACGYGDGYPRQVSGHGAAVLIQGQRCPILGRVTMDQIMVDVTDVEEPVQAGDEAVLLGRQGEMEISASEIAGKAGTIPWHVFTGITARVARKVK
jgi:alanine racemase